MHTERCLRLRRVEKRRDECCAALLLFPHPLLLFSLASRDALRTHHGASLLHGCQEYAIHCYTKLLKKEPGDDAARQCRTHAYFEAGEYARAVTGYIALLRSSPHDTTLLRQAASCYSFLGRPQSGVNLLQGYVEWFKEQMEKRERRERREKRREKRARKKQRRDEQGTANITASASEEDEEEEDEDEESVREEDESAESEAEEKKSESTEGGDGAHPPPRRDPPLSPSDLDIHLVNILCELLLRLRKHGDVVELLEELRVPILAAYNKDVPPEQCITELPFDLNSKLAMSLLFRGDAERAQAILAPLSHSAHVLLQQFQHPELLAFSTPPPPYDVSEWGDLYFEVAEAYEQNGLLREAEVFLACLRAHPSWAENAGVVRAQARCAHRGALEAIEGKPAGAPLDAQTEQMLQNALHLYKESQALEQAATAAAKEAGSTAAPSPESEAADMEARLSLAEITQLLVGTAGDEESWRAFLRDINPDEIEDERATEIYERIVARTAGAQEGGAAVAEGKEEKERVRAPRSSTSSSAGSSALGASLSTKYHAALRAFHARCDTLLRSEANNKQAFLALVVPAITQILAAAAAGTKKDGSGGGGAGEEEEDAPLHMKEPQFDSAAAQEQERALAAQAADAAMSDAAEPPFSSPHLLYSLLSSSPPSPHIATRLTLAFEFLLPAWAAMKLLYSASRFEECMWMVHQATRVLHRHLSNASGGSSGSIHGPSKLLSVGGAAAARSGQKQPLSLFPGCAGMGQNDQLRHLLACLRCMSGAIHIYDGEFDRAYAALRHPFHANPASFSICHALARVLDAHSYSGRVIRAVQRLYEKKASGARAGDEEADRSRLPSINMLMGHSALVHQSFDVAFQHYSVLYRTRPKEPAVLLLMGVAKLQYALRKTNRHRHHDLLLAFAFLFQYLDEQKERAKQHHQPYLAQEGYYNVARAFHYVNLAHMAIHFYNKALAVAVDGDIVAPSSASASSSSSPRPMLYRECAHNLALLYQSSGSHDLARHVYMQYCAI